MSFRKETKFRVTSSDQNIIKGQLIQRGMKILYPKRIINSQYFDTRDYQMFSESEEGLLPRKKVRVRWYENNDNYTLETKTSSIEGRFKENKKINSHIFEKYKSMGINTNNYGLILPTALISYGREYFFFKGMRITFDSNINYKFYGSNFKYNDPERVIEIKTTIDFPQDLIQKLFPIPTSRFSKYSRAFLARDKML